MGRDVDVAVFAAGDVEKRCGDGGEGREEVDDGTEMGLENRGAATWVDGVMRGVFGGAVDGGGEVLSCRGRWKWLGGAWEAACWDDDVRAECDGMQAEVFGLQFGVFRKIIPGPQLAKERAGMDELLLEVNMHRLVVPPCDCAGVELQTEDARQQR